MIMPNSFHGNSFTQRAMRQIKVAVTAPTPSTLDMMTDEENERYYDSVMNLLVKSSDVSEVETSEGTSGPNVVGYGYSANVTIVLEGHVFATSVASDDDLKNGIAKTINEYWYDEDRFSSMVNELTSELRGIDSHPDTSSTAKILSFSRIPDGTANVTVELTVTVEAGESVHNRNDRIRSEQGEHEHDLWNDER